MDSSARSSQKRREAVTLRAVLLVFTGSLLLLLLLASISLGLTSFRDYISGQLSDHAQDGATALGMSLSHAIDGSDPVASASLIDAAFDSSRYLSVQYLDTAGDTVAARIQPLGSFGVPAWFMKLADIPLTEGQAEVTRGWRLLGTVRVISDPQQAYQDLWNITLGLVALNAIIGGLGLLALYLILTRTLSPLRELEAQAQAVSHRDFSRRVTTTSTRELNRVTRAMNQMSDDLGVLFEGQGRLIQHLRQLNNEDPVTGLASRTAFDRRLRVEVESEERAAPGGLLLFQLSDFSDFNQRFGRDTADELLASVASVVREFELRHAGVFAGRRMGAEIAVYMPGAGMADSLHWSNELIQAVDGLYSDAAVPLEVAVYGGVAQASEGMTIGDLLSAADEAMRQAQADGVTGCHGRDPSTNGHRGAESWRAVITEALASKSVGIWKQPVIRSDGETRAFNQVFSRIRCDDDWIRAGVYVPIAERFGLMPAIDLLVLDKALQLLRQDPGQQLALAVGQSSVADQVFRDTLIGRLKDAPTIRKRLWVGISEQTIHHHRKPATALALALKKLGVGMVVDHFGVGGVPFTYLQGLPIRALRVDHSFVHNIASHDDNRFYLEQVTSIAHGVGVQVFATGVETASEWETVQKMGLDGAMGYHLGRPKRINGDGEH
ncbi:bifunctional diguanylate cyclase/phosphodiesterase [Marinobacter zhejiangensis]|uniref:Diguanylate cyclase/phosphodiesterase n=1 Tax=Marinobacter zhejiangensis TaxID=488535 RepID=A0A1I4KY96_9GAMM|nr:EAL domain-containing protein [Marinobacter zhejiangensis]SFL83499.1 diguanylate cyclase/phosphodiesterase [Marinobacter zhejiangensis]